MALPEVGGHAKVGPSQSCCPPMKCRRFRVRSVEQVPSGIVLARMFATRDPLDPADADDLMAPACDLAETVIVCGVGWQQRPQRGPR